MLLGLEVTYFTVRSVSSTTFTLMLFIDSFLICLMILLRFAVDFFSIVLPVLLPLLNNSFSIVLVIFFISSGWYDLIYANCLFNPMPFSCVELLLSFTRKIFNQNDLSTIIFDDVKTCGKMTFPILPTAVFRLMITHPMT
eukprot:Lithocolla_globosa_v1_NODE_3978_length_1537_cov_692.281861.p3 type:complete len:140 gc:universal NODE_3978_length_1537_cov_692.281861:1249-830(-)